MENLDMRVECHSCGENTAEIEGFNCEQCMAELKAEIENWDKETIVKGLSNQRMVKWIQNVFESQKNEYLECGYLDESYQEFLINTFEATSQTFPETIEKELKN